MDYDDSDEDGDKSNPVEGLLSTDISVPRDSADLKVEEEAAKLYADATPEAIFASEYFQSKCRLARSLSNAMTVVPIKTEKRDPQTQSQRSQDANLESMLSFIDEYVTCDC